MNSFAESQPLNIPRSTGKCRPIDISKIDIRDDCYRITTKTNVADLVTSMGIIGLINPPILIHKDDHFRIVSGYRRVAACREIGKIKVNGRILALDTPDRVCAHYAIADNTLQRTLNLIEISRSLNILNNYTSNYQQLIEEASRLGLPNNPSFVKKLIPICVLPHAIQQGILSDKISLPMALALGNLPVKDGVALAMMFQNLNMGLNKQREILTHITEISHRDNVSLEALYNGEQVQKILGDDELDLAQKARAIRYFLKRCRFPALTEAENRFEKHVAALHLGYGMQLLPAPYFENNTLQLRLSFKNLKQLNKHQETLNSVADSPHLASILA